MPRLSLLAAPVLCLTLSAGASAAALPLADWSDASAANPPAAIRLPELLTRQIATMTAQTRQDSHERGVCLFSNAGGITTSSIFRGDRYAIDLSKQAATCAQPGMIGLIHTHPAVDTATTDLAYRATPSLDDFVQFGFSGFATSIVAHEQYVCALLQAPHGQPLVARGTPSPMQDYVLSMLSVDLPDPGKSSETTLRAIATAAASRGQLFYCGSNGEALQKVAPRESGGSLNRLILASQALVLGQYLSGNYPYPPPTFNFSPLAERTLARYLNAAIGEKAGIDFTRLSPRQTFETLLQFHWNIDRSIAAVAGSFSVTQRKEDARAYSFGCVRGSCTLFTNRNFRAYDRQANDQAVAAFAFTDDGYKSFINLSASERMMHDVAFSNGSSLHYRQRKTADGQWVPVAGSAEWKFAEGRAVGSIDRGLIAGPVMVYLKDGRVFRGTVGEQLSLSLDEQVQ